MEKKTLAEAAANLKKKYGYDVVMEMDKNKDFKVDTISTGCFSLDAAFGNGIPKGRIIEVFGEESSGKSTLSQFIIAQLQKSGGKAALIDVENAFDGEYAKNIGVKVDELLVAQPATLEESFDVVKELVETNEVDIIVVDSVAALVPKSEAEGEEMLKDSMAVQARLMSKALRILTGPISKSKTIVIFINQVRDKVGVMFGKKETTPGGKALKFFASIRVEVKKGEAIKDSDGKQIGNWLKATMVKNKVGFPWQKAEFELYYAKGIDLHGDALDYGEQIGVIAKSGNSYSFGETKLGNNRGNAKNKLASDEELYQKVRKAIDEKILSLSKK